MLELLACSLFVTIRNCLIVDFDYIREAINNKGPQENCIRNFVLLYRQAHQVCESFQLGYLNKAVYVVVLEEQALEFGKSLKFGDVRGSNDVIKAYVLE